MIGRRVPVTAISAIAAACVLSACTGSAGLRDGAVDNNWSLCQPYHYPLAGMGGGHIVGSVLIPENREAAIATQALVLTLQDQQLSITQPVLEPDGIITPMTLWITDIAPLSHEIVNIHNQKFPLLVLRAARYGIQYEGLYDTAGRMWRYRISARLYERGVLSSAWAVVANDRYSGQFFVERLAEAIKSHLEAGGE